MFRNLESFGSLQLATVGVFTPQKLADARNQLLVFGLWCFVLLFVLLFVFSFCWLFCLVLLLFVCFGRAVLVAGGHFRICCQTRLRCAEHVLGF